MVERPQWADPSAEETTDKDSWDQDHQPPQQAFVKSAAGKDSHEAGERVEFQGYGNREREDYLRTHAEYADDRRRRDAFNKEIPDNLLNDYVTYFRLDTEAERDLYRLEHSEFDKWGRLEDTMDWKPV